MSAGERVPFVLTWHPSWLRRPEPVDPYAAVDETEAWWADWMARCTYDGAWQGEVRRSLLVLKALTFHPDRRDRGRRHHEPAGADRRPAQLGLPLLLAARRGAHPAGAARRRVTSPRPAAGGTGCCARSPATRPSCRSCTASTGSRRHTGAGAALAVRVRGLHAGPGRQRRGRAVAARRVGRDARRAGTSPARPACPAATTPGRCRSHLLEFLEGHWQRARTTACGRCAATGSTSCTRR